MSSSAGDGSAIHRLSQGCEETIIVELRRLKRSPLQRLLLLFALVSVAIASAACGQPFRVPEQVRPISGRLGSSTTLRGLTLGAEAIVDEDKLIELFEANMMLARILVVKLTLKNQGGGSVDFHDLEFDLRDLHGHRFEFLQPRKAVEKLYDYYEINNYVIFFRKELEEDFERQGLQTKDELQPGEERKGLVFFEIPEEVDNLSPLDGLTLRLKRLHWPGVEKNVTVELLLSR